TSFNSPGLNNGVVIAGTGTLVTTVDGDIFIDGGNTAGGNNNIGLYINTGAQVSSTGTGADAGTITLHGVSTGGGFGNRGISIRDAGTLVSSVDGNIQITGTGSAA